MSVIICISFLLCIEWSGNNDETVSSTLVTSNTSTYVPPFSSLSAVFPSVSSCQFSLHSRQRGRESFNKNVNGLNKGYLSPTRQMVERERWEGGKGPGKVIILQIQSNFILTTRVIKPKVECNS